MLQQALLQKNTQSHHRCKSQNKSDSSKSPAKSKQSSNSSEYDSDNKNSINDCDTSPPSSSSSYDFTNSPLKIPTLTSFGNIKSGNDNSSNSETLTDSYFENLDIYSSSSPNVTPITPMALSYNSPPNKYYSAVTAAANKLALQQFMEKVEYCRNSVRNKAFKLFKDSSELRENDVVNAAFKKYNNNQ